LRTNFGSFGRAIKNLNVHSIVEISVEYLLLIEEKIKALSDEHGAISRDLPRFKFVRHTGRYLDRMNELDYDMRSLWRRYRMLSELIE
jgi:hypothetical protein